MIIRSLVWSVAAAAALSLSLPARGAVIAHWQFEPGATFLNDSSGNGYHFVDAGLIGVGPPESSTDKPATAPVNGSARFDGATHFAQTAAPVLLSAHSWVRVSYWLKEEGTLPDQVYLENSYDTNPTGVNGNIGSTFHVSLPSGQPAGSMMVSYRTKTGSSSTSTNLDLASFGTNDVWHFVQADYNLAEVLPEDRVQVVIDGVAGTTFRNITGTHTWAAHRDDLWYIGGRRGLDVVPTLMFTGKIADLKIESISTAVPGDFDGDGDVDGADFVAWQTNFPKATGATLAEGDADGDGDVDGADFVVWQTNFPFTPGSAAAPVPEPSTLSLVCIAGLALSLRRWRRPERRNE